MDPAALEAGRATSTRAAVAFTTPLAPATSPATVVPPEVSNAAESPPQRLQLGDSDLEMALAKRHRWGRPRKDASSEGWWVALERNAKMRVLSTLRHGEEHELARGRTIKDVVSRTLPELPIQVVVNGTFFGHDELGYLSLGHLRSSGTGLPSSLPTDYQDDPILVDRIRRLNPRQPPEKRTYLGVGTAGIEWGLGHPPAQLVEAIGGLLAPDQAYPDDATWWEGMSLIAFGDISVLIYSRPTDLEPLPPRDHPRDVVARIVNSGYRTVLAFDGGGSSALWVSGYGYLVESFPRQTRVINGLKVTLTVPSYVAFGHW